MARAISQLIQQFPIGGYTLLGEAIRVAQSSWVGTAGTDGRNVYYCPTFWVDTPETGPYLYPSA